MKKAVMVVAPVKRPVNSGPLAAGKRQENLRRLSIPANALAADFAATTAPRRRFPW